MCATAMASTSNQCARETYVTTSKVTTWTQFFALFSKSGSKLERVLVLNSSGDLVWLAPRTASGTGAVGQVRVVQVATRLADTSRITWHARLSPRGALRDTLAPDELNWTLLRRLLSTMSSSPESTAKLH